MHTLDFSQTQTSKGTLVCLHGLGSSPYFYSELASYLPEYAVRAITLPGHMGREPLADMSFAALAKVLEGELPSEPYVLIGHSWGAEIARELAELRPEQLRKLILLDGAYLEAKDFGETLETQLENTRTFCRTTRFENKELFLASEQAEVEHWNAHLERAALAQMKVEASGELSLAVDEETACKIIRSMNQEQPNKWAQVDVPIQLFAATQPPELNPIRKQAIQRLQRQKPGVEVTEVATTHDILRDDGKLLAQMIQTSLAELIW